MGDFYYYFEMNALGDYINELKFLWLDADRNPL